VKKSLILNNMHHFGSLVFFEAPIWLALNDYDKPKEICYSKTR